MQEAEEKALKLFEEKEARRAELKAAIEKSRKHQIEKRRFEKEQETKEEKDFQQFWKARSEELSQAEMLEREEIRQK